MNTLEPKKCLACGKIVKGRIDKKFCDDGCRNNYNNTQNSDATNLIRNVNNTLRKNRRIIEDIIEKSETDTAKATKTKLIDLGYNFKYFTNTYTNKKGMIYYFVYEYGFLPLENDWLFLVKRNEEQK
jgi:predicted nucleic acid-binding Zn ribbon protein